MDFLTLQLVSLTGIFAVFIMPIIMIIFIVWFKTKQKNKQDKLKADLIAKAIESGQTISENIFETKGKKTPLQKGIIWTAVAVGFALFFVFVSIAENNYNQILQGVGCTMIPLFIGIAHLLIHFISKKQTKENGSDK